MNAALAGWIGARGDHSALFGSPTNRKGLSNQGRITLFFDSAEESIQVKMQDFSRHSFQSIDYNLWPDQFRG
jgi:hypothetical protein